jgi:L-ribulokinase
VIKQEPPGSPVFNKIQTPCLYCGKITATREAAEINDHANKFPFNYLQYVGGIYSSEWFWAKLLHILREDKALQKNCYSFAEHCDWIPFLLTGGNDISKMKRGVCSAGHKALWAADFGGLPPNDFFASLDTLLDGFRSRLFDKTYTADTSAGNLSQEWAGRLGLSIDVVVGVGAFDAHVGPSVAKSNLSFKQGNGNVYLRHACSSRR